MSAESANATARLRPFRRTAPAAVVALLALGLARQAQAVEKANQQVSPFYGSFSYSIPIEVPSFRGLEPKLALSYSSEGRNGIFGVGWGLSGFSTIERANPARGTPRFDGNDIYLLDGQELVACQGGSVSPSCTTGGNWSTKIESYLKIQFNSSTNLWTIWGKDGTRTVFSPILQIAPGTLRWGQTSAVDTKGNTVTYQWSCVGGDCYPDLITYNGYRITLYRESRPDIITFPTHVGIGQTQYRVRSIVVSLPGVSNIRAYKLSYTTSPLTSRSLLTAVQAYGKDVVVDGAGLITDGTSLPPQTFSYQNDAIGRTFPSWASAPPLCDAIFRTGDFNGDGKTDWLCYANYPGLGATRVALSTGTGFAAPTTWLADYQIPAAGLFVGDFNADGKTDLAYHHGGNGFFSVGLSTGSSFATPTIWGDAFAWAPDGYPYTCNQSSAVLSTGDFNGDGRLDVSCHLVGRGERFIGLNTGSSFNFSIFAQTGCEDDERTGFMDLDGDGKDDFYCIGATQGYFVGFFSTGSSFSYYSAVIGPELCGATYLNHVLGDFNGDGRTDVGCMSNGKVALSTGWHYTVPAGSGTCTGHTSNFLAADVDGDGASEIVCNGGGAGPTDIEVRKWNGTSLGPPEVWRANWCSGLVQAGDFNGDGKSDLYCDNLPVGVAVAGTAGVQVDLLTSAANGMGGTTQLTYTPSTGFPNTNNPPPKHAVTSLTQLDGRGWSATRTYSYSGGLMDRMERRFLGFRNARETLPCISGEATCPYRDLVFRQDLASAGKPERIAHRNGAGRLLRDAYFAYTTNGPTIPRTSLLTSDAVHFYDGSAPDCTAWPCAQAMRTATQHDYDAYGNRIQTRFFGHSDASGDETTIRWVYVPNTAAYIVDRVA